MNANLHDALSHCQNSLQKSYWKITEIDRKSHFLTKADFEIAAFVGSDAGLVVGSETGEKAVETADEVEQDLLSLNTVVENSFFQIDQLIEVSQLSLVE